MNHQRSDRPHYFCTLLMTIVVRGGMDAVTELNYRWWYCTPGSSSGNMVATFPIIRTFVMMAAAAEWWSRKLDRKDDSMERGVAGQEEFIRGNIGKLKSVVEAGSPGITISPKSLANFCSTLLLRSLLQRLCSMVPLLSCGNLLKWPLHSWIMNW